MLKGVTDIRATDMKVIDMRVIDILVTDTRVMTLLYNTGLTDDLFSSRTQKKQLTQGSRNRYVKSRLQMERAGRQSPKPCPVERSR